MNKIKLIFHVGRQKTATSFIQKNAKKIDNIYFLGKFFQEEKLSRYRIFINDLMQSYDAYEANEFEGKINKIHNKLIKSFRGEFIGRYPNDSINNFQLLEDYSQEIVKIILSNYKNFSSFVISDENISDYLNYKGEQNIAFFTIIGNLVEEKLINKITVSKYFSLTIRNQIDILHSIYCYNSFYNGSFKRYIKSELESNSPFSSSIYYYKCYNYIKKLAGNSWKVNLVPYEILKTDKNPSLFLSKVFCSSSEESNLYKNINNEFVNNNSTESDREVKIKRFGTVFYRYGHILSSGYKHSLKLSIQKNYISKFYFYFIVTCGNFLISLHFFFRKLKLVKREKKVKIDEESINLIKKVYMEDNKMLNEILIDIDLKKYGYI